MTISAEEHEVISFFEVLPFRLDPEIDWPYNDFVFEVQQGNLSLSCAIAPADQDSRIILKQDGSTIFESNVVGLADIKYRNEKSVECLEFVLSDKERIRLVLKPNISITHHGGGEI